MFMKVTAGLMSLGLLGFGYYWWSSSQGEEGVGAPAVSVLPQSSPLPATLPKQTTLAGIVANPCRARCRRLEGRARLRCTKACRERQRYLRCAETCGKGPSSTSCKENCSRKARHKQGKRSTVEEGEE